jgi:hypothetical protein
MPNHSCQLGHGPLSSGTAPNHEAAAAKQPQPGSDHSPGQQTEGQYVIHDMITEPQRNDANSTTGDAQDLMQMLDELERGMSRHQSSHPSSPDTASPGTAEPKTPNGAENDRLQNLSWAMRCWESQLFEPLPWHCAEVVGDKAGGGPHNNGLAGMDGKDTNGCDGAVETDEEAWSNQASAGAGEEDTEG